ncbi:MAG: class I SAM-dependent methyltransferase [Ruminococcus sp.]|nr:class I SAM-dependent methyltransferase [Ruminococcus sp.]
MSGYKDFAACYKLLQSGVDYDGMAALVHRLIDTYGDEHECVVDLACGCGDVSFRLARLGYYVIGVDVSEAMLYEAEKGLAEYPDLRDSVTFVRQDMSELELWGAADAVVCLLDSINHLESVEKLEKTVERVSMFTCDGGLFIFDVNTEFKHTQVLGSNSFVFEEDGLLCTWRNFCGRRGDVEIMLDFFSRNRDGSYDRSSEYFVEKLFGPELLEGLLKKYCFEVIAVFDGFSQDPPGEETERLLYVCKRLPGGRGAQAE